MALKVGIQMYSVFADMSKDFKGTVKRVSEIGYKNLEFLVGNAAMDYGVCFAPSVEKTVSFFNDIGVRVVGNHVRVGDNNYADVDYTKFFEGQRELGNKLFVLPHDFFNSNEDIKCKSELYNLLGRKCKDAGMKFAFHNHIEIGHVYDGKLALDTLAEYTDPELVGFEIDTYWALRAGLDPVETIKKYGSRILALHQKDIPASISKPVNVYDELDKSKPYTMEDFTKFHITDAFTEIGTGVMRIQEIIDAALEHSKAEYIILEQDKTSRSALDSIAISMDNFKKYSGLDFD